MTIEEEGCFFCDGERAYKCFCSKCMKAIYSEIDISEVEDFCCHIESIIDSGEIYDDIFNAHSAMFHENNFKDDDDDDKQLFFFVDLEFFVKNEFYKISFQTEIAG